jgi:hypothetical protein
MNELREILDTMQVPEIRKGLTENDVRYLLRNLGFNNREHPKFARAIELLKQEAQRYFRERRSNTSN